MTLKNDLTVFLGKMSEEYLNGDILGFNLEITFRDWTFKDPPFDDAMELGIEKLELYIVPESQRANLDKEEIENITKFELLDNFFWIKKCIDETNILIPYSSIIIFREI